jgi:hypothetical protein
MHKWISRKMPPAHFLPFFVFPRHIQIELHKCWNKELKELLPGLNLSCCLYTLAEWHFVPLCQPGILQKGSGFSAYYDASLCKEHGMLCFAATVFELSHPHSFCNFVFQRNQEWNCKMTFFCGVMHSAEPRIIYVSMKWKNTRLCIFLWWRAFLHL